MNAPAEDLDRRPASGTWPRAADDTERALLRQGILDYAILLGDSGPSFDFKELLTHSRMAHAAGRLLWSLVRGFAPEVLVGPGFGGTPLLYATAMAAWELDRVELAIWMVRDQRKTYYGKRWVEGPRFAHEVRAVMLDDFLGHGSAVELVDQALASEGFKARIAAIAVLFDSWSPRGSRQLSVGRCPVVSVFKRHDIGMSRDCHDARPPLMRGAAPPLIERPAWWRFDFNGAHDYPLKSAPAIADGAVFAADDRSRVWRFDGLTGEACWSRDSAEVHEKGIVQRLQVVDGSVVYGCYDGTVTRLDSASGDIIWRWRVDSGVHATPVVDLASGRLFVNTESFDEHGAGGQLMALDWASGRTLWRRRHAFWPPATACHDGATGAVVATCNDQSLICVDAHTGELRWSAATDGLVRGQPAIDAGVALVATENGWLETFDLQTGEPLRRRRYGAGRFHQFTLAENGVVHTLDDSGHLCAFDTDSLRLRWLGKLRSPGAWTPVRWGAHLVVLSEQGHLAVFDAGSGLKHWEGVVGRGEYMQPPAIGIVAGTPMLVCASHHSGLRSFALHPHYSSPPHP